MNLTPKEEKYLKRILSSKKVTFGKEKFMQDRSRRGEYNSKEG